VLVQLAYAIGVAEPVSFLVSAEGARPQCRNHCALQGGSTSRLPASSLSQTSGRSTTPQPLWTLRQDDLNLPETIKA
jgi:hypothetical protein